MMFGRPDQARLRADRAVSLARQLNNPDGTHLALHVLGRALAVDDAAAACEAFEAGAAAARRVGSRFNVGQDLLEAARLRHELGDLKGAGHALLEVLNLLVPAGNRSELSYCFLQAARLLADERQPELAFTLFHARAGMPEMPAPWRHAADRDLEELLANAVGTAATRLSVRAQSIPEHDLVVMCRSGLEDIVHADWARAARASARRLPDVVVAYTDLVASTELNVKVGDRRYLDLLHEHNQIIRQRLELFGGVEFAHTGDGIAAMFDALSNAVQFAVGLQPALDDANESHPTVQLLIRVGLARGEAISEGGNLFGQTVTRAARICAAAGAGQVLASEDVTAGADQALVWFRPVGTYPLKGFGISVPLFEATPALADTG
jgi:class 3 adenylate cyclase